MKNSKTLCLLTSASMAHALVGITWNTSGASSSGMTDITFPINIADAPHTTGFYFAQQFNFVGSNSVGYTGLQPRPDVNGKPQIHIAFSSFVAGTTSSDPNCSDGADGGAGVSCATDISDSYDDTYLLKVENVGGTTWKGTAVNSATGDQYHVGQYTLPAAIGGIKNSQLGFIEYYPWNAQASHQCGELPPTAVTFYPPTTKTGGSGSLNAPYEYGDCVGTANYKMTAKGNAWYVSVGFVGGNGS